MKVFIIAALLAVACAELQQAAGPTEKDQPTGPSTRDQPAGPSTADQPGQGVGQAAGPRLVDNTFQFSDRNS